MGYTKRRCFKIKTKIVAITLLLLTCYGISFAALNFHSLYFVPNAKNINNNMYNELSYSRKYWDVGVGYMNIWLNGVQGNSDTMDVIQLRLGGKIPIKKFELFGGILNPICRYHGDTLSPVFGGYAGVRYEINDRFSIEARYQMADIDLDAPLIEDESNLNAWFIGGTIRW